MPRLFSLVLAFLAWQWLEDNPRWVDEPQPVGLIALPGIAWLFGLRWSLPRKQRPWEAHPLVLALLPVVLYAAWMGPFGGLRLWEEWELPPILASWIGLAPYLVFQFFIRYGEGGLAGLAEPERSRFAMRQTAGLLLGIFPLALVTQAWDSGFALLPEDEAAWTLGQRGFALLLQVVVPLIVLQGVIIAIPFLLGAKRGAREWQEVADRLWDGRGPTPKILEWPTLGLIANAVAVGFGPFRKVLLSDRLLSDLRPAEVEAVLAHELAHLRRNHSVSLLLGVFGAVLCVAALLELVQPAGRDPGWIVSLLPLLGALVFIPASRVFEMQADLDAGAHGPVVGTALVGALTLLGTHSPRLSLRHLAGPRRVSELQRCAGDPGRVAGWQRRARGWSLGLRALFLAGLAAGVWVGI